MLVDVVTGDEFARPPGTGDDAHVPKGTVPDGAQDDGTPPTGEEELIYSVASILGVREDPPRRATFGIEQALYVTRIMTYHYNNNETPAETTGLCASDGTIYGPWPAEGSEGQGGVPDAYWTAYPATEIPPGRWTVQY